MHPLIKQVLSAMVDDKVINWEVVYKEMNSSLIMSERDRRRMAAIRLIYDVIRYEVNLDGK
jgi:hypothetical protein